MRISDCSSDVCSSDLRPAYGATGMDQYLGWLCAWRNDVLGEVIHPIIDAGMDYLSRERPQDLPISVVWGDSNPGNMLFKDDLTVSAVLDFEAAALGPAELDLGWWLFLEDRKSVVSGKSVEERVVL